MLRVYRQALRDGTLTMRSTLAFSANWPATGGAPLGPFVEAWAGWLGEPGLGNDMLKMGGLYVQSAAGPPTTRAPSASPYTGWAGFNSGHGLPPDKFRELLLQCARNDIRAVAIAGGGGLGVLDYYEEVDKQIPLKGRRWVVSHVNVISPRDIERIARMGLVLTTHTNAYLYKALETTASKLKPEQYDDIVPMNALREAGITVSLATDNTPISLFYPIAQTVARKDYKTKRMFGAKQALSRMRRAALCDQQRRLSHLRRGQEGLARTRQVRRPRGVERRSAHGRGRRPRRHSFADDHGGWQDRLRNGELGRLTGPEGCRILRPCFRARDPSANSAHARWILGLFLFQQSTLRRGARGEHREVAMADDKNPIPRRNFLLGAGTAVATGLASAAAAPAEAQTPAAAPPADEPLLTLTATEHAFFLAAADTMIPADELSPSGGDCGVATFIDRQLAGAYGSGARLYREGPFPKAQARTRLSASAQSARILPRRYRRGQRMDPTRPTARSSTGCRKPIARPR